MSIAEIEPARAARRRRFGSRSFPPWSSRATRKRQLADCLSCLGFADEIVVVLDRCDDRSPEIARRFTDRVIEGAWEREGERRNAGIAACRGDWVLEIDADERVGPELAAEIARRRRAVRRPTGT